MSSSRRNILIATLAAFTVLLVITIISNLRYDGFVEKYDLEKAKTRDLPMLVEFGYEACPPCKMMKPVLESLNREYSDEFAIGYVDVIENPKVAETYNLQAYPTLVFYDKQGNELDRVIGYLSEEQILKKWQELGII